MLLVKTNGAKGAAMRLTPLTSVGLMAALASNLLPPTANKEKIEEEEEEEEEEDHLRINVSSIGRMGQGSMPAKPRAFL